MLERSGAQFSASACSRPLTSPPPPASLLDRQLNSRPSAESQILLASEPLFAALFGFLLLDEQLGAAEYLGGAFVIGGGLVVSGIFGCCEEPEQPDSASALLVGGLASQSNRMPSVDLIQFVNQKGAMFEDEVSPGKIAFPNPLDETNEKE